MTYTRQDRIAETPKRKRMQLAKSELWLLVANSHAVTSLGEGLNEDGYATMQRGYLPPDGAIMHRYGLTPEDIQRLAAQIGAELETKAIRAGFEDHWQDEDVDY